MAIPYQFDHVHFFCTDLKATEHWFVDQMGAELVEHQDSSGIPAAVVRLGGTTILLRGNRPGEQLAPAGPSRFGTDHIGVRVPDLDAAASELKRRGVVFESEPRQMRPGLRIAFVSGPDQVRIEIVERQPAS